MARRRAQSPTSNVVRHIQASETEAEDNTTKSESQQVLAVSSFIKKPKSDDKEVQQFRVMIAADQKELKERLVQRTLQAKKQEQRRRDELISTILKALRTPNPPPQTQNSDLEGTRIASNAVYASITNVLSASDALVKQYQRIDGMITSLRDQQTEPIAETLKQEIEETDRQLKMGVRVALRNVKKVIGVEVEASEDKDGDVNMEGSEKMELNYGLQESLRYAERGVKRMVKPLPMDEA